MKTKLLGFLGAGNMSGALIKGLLHGKVLPAERILASDVKGDRLDQLHTLHGIRVTTDNHALVREADVLVLAVATGLARRPGDAEHAGHGAGGGNGHLRRHARA
jgi:pyrroline-5-carboxylate reductase